MYVDIVAKLWNFNETAKILIQRNVKVSLALVKNIRKSYQPKEIKLSALSVKYIINNGKVISPCKFLSVLGQWSNNISNTAHLQNGCHFVRPQLSAQKNELSAQSIKYVFNNGKLPPQAFFISSGPMVQQYFKHCSLAKWTPFVRHQLSAQRNEFSVPSMKYIFNNGNVIIPGYFISFPGQWSNSILVTGHRQKWLPFC